MRHQVKKIKFSLGRDANRMLMRKLACNFLIRGKIQTTIERTRSLKSYLEKIASKSIQKNEANKNYLLKKLGDIKLVNVLFTDIGPKLKGKKSGYVRMIKIGSRSSDGAAVARLEWTLPIVVTEKEKSKVEINKNKNV